MLTANIKKPYHTAGLILTCLLKIAFTIVNIAFVRNIFNIFTLYHSNVSMSRGK